MKELDDIVVESLDGVDREILPYIPYILQDLWALGAQPEVVLGLVRSHAPQGRFRVLDLGCGKGAASIHLAKNLDCEVRGIDALPAFIEAARGYAFLHGVQDQCEFITGDIRELVANEEQYDVVLLGAIGSVLGDMYQTLMSIRPLLNEGGLVVIDDGYLKDGSQSDYDRCLSKTEFFRQIEEAGFAVAQEEIFSPPDDESEAQMFEAIKTRVHELVEREPQHKELFLGYLASQEYEFDIISHELVTGTWGLVQVPLRP